MKIQVNKFYLKHNGKLYKSGDVVDIADENTAKRLVSNSKGAYSLYQVLAGSTDAPKPVEAAANTGETTLPDADPAKAVAGKKK